jgi:hypothetical protein
VNRRRLRFWLRVTNPERMLVIIAILYWLGFAYLVWRELRNHPTRFFH